MATTKGPQFYLNDQDPAEKALIEWADNLGRGRKSTATIETLIIGRELASICQPIADLISSAARRGERVTLEQLEYYIKVFKAESAPKGKAEPVVQSVAKTSEDAIEEPESHKSKEIEEPEEDKQSKGPDHFGDLAG